MATMAITTSNSTSVKAGRRCAAARCAHRGPAAGLRRDGLNMGVSFDGPERSAGRTEDNGLVGPLLSLSQDRRSFFRAVRVLVPRKARDGWRLLGMYDGTTRANHPGRMVARAAHGSALVLR